MASLKTSTVTPEDTARLRAYVEYLRDLGVYDLYRRGAPLAEFAGVLPLAQSVSTLKPTAAPARVGTPAAPTLGNDSPSPFAVSSQRARGAAITPPVVLLRPTPTLIQLAASEEENFLDPALAPPPMALIGFNQRAEIPQIRVAAADKSAALESVRHHIGDCTRCPLAYAGRRKIVFGAGDPNAQLMFVGEGPGADEDESGVPFVGKAGQLLNNMINAMGLKREDVYVANIVKCRPPGNRNPEPVEANTCSQFLVEQIDIVQPQMIVALGAIAATYLLGVKQTLVALRANWHEVRGVKTAVTYHPAYLLRDPKMKGEAWKDLQRVMAEMGLVR